MRCGLTTPPFMQVLPIKRPNSCGIGARYCDALCAAIMTQFLLQLCADFGSVSGNCAKLCACELHKVVRRYAWVVRIAVVLGNECTRLSFERSGTVLCADPPALVWTAVANSCHLRAGCCHTVHMGRRKTSAR